MYKIVFDPMSIYEIRFYVGLPTGKMFTLGRMIEDHIDSEEILKAFLDTAWNQLKINLKNNRIFYTVMQKWIQSGHVIHHLIYTYQSRDNLPIVHHTVEPWSNTSNKERLTIINICLSALNNLGLENYKIDKHSDKLYSFLVDTPCRFMFNEKSFFLYLINEFKNENIEIATNEYIELELDDVNYGLEPICALKIIDKTPPYENDESNILIKIKTFSTDFIYHISRDKWHSSDQIEEKDLISN